jgi:antitoxin VapB
MTEQESRLAAFCRENKFDGALLRRRSNIAWLTGGGDVHCDTATSLGVATLVWTPTNKIVSTDNIEAPRLAAEEFSSDWQIMASEWWKPVRAAHGRLATDFPRDNIAELRFSLTPAEIKRLRALGRDSADALEASMKRIRVGWTEHQIAGEVVGTLRAAGIFAHVLLVAADDRVGRFRHPIPTSRRVRKKAMVAICAQRTGLIVSMTRLVHFGRLPDDLRRRHAAVCHVDRALHIATRPGRRWCDALAAGIEAYADAGFPDEWKLHHQGGPMGYECRDFKATPTEKRAIQQSQAVGWNPSITGTKSEDTILSGGEILTAMKNWPTDASRPSILVRRT